MDQTQDPNATVPGATSTPATDMQIGQTPVEPAEKPAEMPGTMPGTGMPTEAPAPQPVPPMTPEQTGTEPAPEVPGETSTASEEPENEENPTGASTV